ncbi:peroxiredoxin [Limimaricola hongkongensis]|uniref:Glutathione-dependent peroxiredoxin n=1 Tax=Limimaricola hongkongensis DSM 17492 TaxID=1122180 RepID=A0A017HG59_9RHOB|nr:peroxiredoxin [Limimaricola hongkongensis]EYD73346.1 Antioxidant, AhpC/Tsa family [Limimaricola hongkongensis DSM 17492]
MTISTGDRLPGAALMRMGEDGPETVALEDILKGRRVVIFGLPGAFTGTCSSAHVPSFLRSMGALKAKGVDEVVCIAVNDPFVMRAWGEDTGATAAGIAMLADPEGAFTAAIGMVFSNPARGLIGRSKRYALMAEDGVVRVWHPEEGTACDISGGESMVAAL